MARVTACSQAPRDRRANRRMATNTPVAAKARDNRRVRQLRSELYNAIDARGDRPDHCPAPTEGAHSEGDTAELRERQDVTRGVANESRPHESPLRSRGIVARGEPPG